jgi:hypothetical protein
MANYPEVHGEWETLRQLQQGFSIARFGDGEFKMMDGAGYVREPPNKKLAAELRSTLRSPHRNCLVAIPTMDSRGDKYASWSRHKERFAKILRRARGPFYSAFISRPDSAQWIRTLEFAVEVRELWRGRKIAVLCEKESGTLRALADQTFDHIVCPSHKAYAHIDHFERELAELKPDIAILSCGMTATCLANRLARRGIQAIDFGSGGSFIAKLLFP